MNTQSRESEAARRMRMILPLIEEGLSHSDLVGRKKDICDKYDVSYRTVSRYHEAYLSSGYQGLMPKSGYRRPSQALPPGFEQIVDEAIILRRENPSRSVKDIIRILELERVIERDSVSRSTLQRHLQQKGFGASQVRLYTKRGAASRRFAKPHRCMLFQGDIKYGPHIPIHEGEKRKQVYLSAFIDDATRFIVSAKFYADQRVEIIEDSLREAIMHYGKPDAIYVDNGKQYRSKWLANACDRLGIKLLYAKPYHPEGKGKIEAFNRRMDAFLSEAALAGPKDLKDLNRMLDLWISEHYHKSVHHSLGSVSPEVAFKSDSRPLTFVDSTALISAFLHTEERKVDKTGCISFKGESYEVGQKLIGRKVQIHYDSSWTDEVEIHHKDFEPFKAKRLEIGPNCSSRGALNPEFLPLETDHSRLFDGLNEANISGKTKKEVATIFRKIKEVESDV